MKKELGELQAELNRMENVSSLDVNELQKMVGDQKDVFILLRFNF